MRLQKERIEAAISIKAYQNGQITTNAGVFNSVISLRDGQLDEFTGVADFIDLTFEKIEAHLTLKKPEVLIIGTGKSHQILSARITGKLNEMGVAVESMASRQACHTYQVLSHDQRRVWAIIFP